MAESSSVTDYSRFDAIQDSDSDTDSSSGDAGSTENPLEKLQRASASKDTGNFAFQRQEWNEAKAAYEEGIKLLEPYKNAASGAVTDVQRNEIQKLLCTLYSNKAMVLLKLEDWSGAAKASSAALKIDAANTKALFRRGVAYLQNGRLDEAKADLLQVLSLDPANGPAKKELAAVQRKLQEQRQKEKQSFAGLFERGGGGVYEDKEQERIQKERQQEEQRLKEEDDWRKDNIRRRDLGQSEQTFEEWKKQKEDEKKAAEEEAKKRREEQRSKKVNSGPASKKATTKRSSASSSNGNNSNSNSNSNSDDEYDEEEKQIINETKQKGYCYFRRQPSEEEKQLLANIAPQKVDAPGTERPSDAAAAADADKPARPAGGSAWNFAGTFEERDMTSWAKDRLRQLCLEAAVTDEGVDVQNDPESLARAMESLDPRADPDADMQQLTGLSAQFARIEAKVTKVKKLEGDAQIAVVRGTNRYLFDFNLQLDFEVNVDERAPGAGGSDPPAKKLRGTLNFEELSNTTAENDWECNVSWKTSPSPLYRTRVQKVTDMLRHNVFQKVEEFAQEYQKL